MHLFEKSKELSAKEKKFIAESEKWQQKERAYALIQSATPQSLAYGLNDSPAGLAAWIVEKFRTWSDCHGDVETRFTKDELLSSIMICSAAETINSSFWFYYDAANMIFCHRRVNGQSASSIFNTGWRCRAVDILRH